MIYGGIFSVIFIMLLLKFLGDDPEQKKEDSEDEIDSGDLGKQYQSNESVALKRQVTNPLLGPSERSSKKSKTDRTVNEGDTEGVFVNSKSIDENTEQHDDEETWTFRKWLESMKP